MHIFPRAVTFLCAAALLMQISGCKTTGEQALITAGAVGGAVALSNIIAGTQGGTTAAQSATTPATVASTAQSNRYANCSPFNMNACIAAYNSEQRVKKVNAQRAIEAEQRRIRAAQEKADWERTKNNPLDTAELTQLQTGLKSLGYTSVTRTGVADYATSQAIRELQAKDGQPVTGTATKEVLVAVKRKVGREQDRAVTDILLGVFAGGSSPSSAVSGGGGSNDCQLVDELNHVTGRYEKKCWSGLW